MAYLLLAVAVTTYVFINYIQPYLDIMYEVYKNEKTFELERKELKLQAQKYDLMRKYPEMYNQSTDNVVGFQYESPQEDYYEDEEEEWYDDEFEDDSAYDIEVKKDNTIGYKYDGEIK